jgi:glycosyltransferase involved in cell wall biosynthesis
VGNYVLKVTNGQENTAGEKAKKDITDILSNRGFESVELKLNKSKFIKLFTVPLTIKKQLSRFKKDDVFVIQYPMYSKFATKTIVNECKKRGIHTICLIHDLESLRLYKNDEKKIVDEKNILSRFNCLIVHNEKMREWLDEQKIKVPMISLQIFDYLNDKALVDVKNTLNLIFAGNLEKSSFLEKWNLDKKITVYGVQPSKVYPSNVIYRGVKTPDELPKYLSGSFGLIWDGNSVETNTGIYGEYTKYNNPHKVSLYLSSGLPVIVWKKAAISSFIIKNNLGIVVDSLDDLEDELSKVNMEEYSNMILDVKKMAERLRKGFFTIKAVGEAIDIVNKN